MSKNPATAETAFDWQQKVNLPTYVVIGLRYLRAKRRNQFISFVSSFSLLGMAFGVMALIAVLSVMNGFDRELKRRILSVTPHILLEARAQDFNWRSLIDDVSTDAEVTGAAPYLHTSGLLYYERGLEGLEIQGIDPNYEKNVSKINSSLLLGKLDDLKAGEYGIILGRLSARNLGVMPGDKLLLTLPQVQVTPAGLFPRVKYFTLVGVFEIGAQADQTLALIHLEDARKLLRFKSQAAGLRIKTSDIYRSAVIGKRLQKTVAGDFQVKDWSQTQGSLFQAIKMEKMVIGLLLMIVVAVAAFNIISSLILMVADKRSDIAVLRTMGMSSQEVMGIFIVQGCATGFFGVFVGVLLGCLLGLYVGNIVSFFESLTGQYIFDPSVYFISQLPSDLQFFDVIIVSCAGLFLSFLATLYPAWRASKIEPAEALRYE